MCDSRPPEGAFGWWMMNAFPLVGSRPRNHASPFGLRYSSLLSDIGCSLILRSATTDAARSGPPIHSFSSSLSSGALIRGNPCSGSWPPPSGSSGWARVSWDQRFSDPITVPGRKPLLTLRDAAVYITKLPRAEHNARNGRPRWKRCCW